MMKKVRMEKIDAVLSLARKEVNNENIEKTLCFLMKKLKKVHVRVFINVSFHNEFLEAQSLLALICLYYLLPDTRSHADCSKIVHSCLVRKIVSIIQQ